MLVAAADRSTFTYIRLPKFLCRQPVYQCVRFTRWGRNNRHRHVAWHLWWMWKLRVWQCCIYWENIDFREKINTVTFVHQKVCLNSTAYVQNVAEWSYAWINMNLNTVKRERHGVSTNVAIVYSDCLRAACKQYMREGTFSSHRHTRRESSIHAVCMIPSSLQ
jgi:hypothetical protein